MQTSKRSPDERSDIRADNETPPCRYADAGYLLESADFGLKAGSIDVSNLKNMLEGMLAKQLLNAAKEASGGAGSA